MDKDIEREYLDIISRVDAGNISVRSVPIKTNALPKIARRDGNNKGVVQRKPLASRKKLVARDFTQEKDYLEV